MKLPQFGNRIVGTSVNLFGWRRAPVLFGGIDVELDINLHYAGGKTERHTVKTWLHSREVEAMAKALGLIPATTPKTTRHHKTVCSHGCKLTPENTIVLKSGLRRCRKHYLEYNAKRNAERRAKRAAAKGGKK